MTDLRVLPPAAKFIKKIKDENLKSKFRKAIDEIIADHTVGEAKHGDLKGLFCYDIYCNNTNYELAYTVEYKNEKTVVIVMAGTRENLYKLLKRRF